MSVTALQTCLPVYRLHSVKWSKHKGLLRQILVWHETYWVALLVLWDSFPITQVCLSYFWNYTEFRVRICCSPCAGGPVKAMPKWPMTIPLEMCVVNLIFVSMLLSLFSQVVVSFNVRYKVNLSGLLSNGRNRVNRQVDHTIWSIWKVNLSSAVTKTLLLTAQNIVSLALFGATLGKSKLVFCLLIFETLEKLIIVDVLVLNH